MNSNQTKTVSIIAVGVAVAVLVGFYTTTNLGPDVEIKTNTFAMDADSVYTELQEGQIFVVDIRSHEEYLSGHIDGSAIDCLYDETLEKRANTIHNRIPEVASSVKIVLVDQDGTETGQIARSMTEKGIETYYLQDGIQSWNYDLVETTTEPQINAEDLWKKIAQDEDIFLLDVRQPEELEVTQISNSINIPLAEVFDSDNLKEIPDDEPVVVICGSGNRATIATYALALEGIDFQVLDGGIKAWDSFLEENEFEPI